VDWNAYTGRNLPYRIRQDPGPTNALGRVKFIFPNGYAVFLHDTPSQQLFDRATRTFSSGCVRVENPFELAELLIDEPDTWNVQQMESVIAEGETKTVFTDPIPVLLLYWTAEVDLDGHLHFYQDVYERDDGVLEALNGEFRLRDRPVVRN
jgi:murein L,D-transpeptidase YcbB/YkuD